jgi:hypothetical protein
MNPLHAPLYAYVMVLFWPWLWWQLRAIERWRQATGRGLQIAADQYGNVHVRWVEDAPDAGNVSAPVSDRLARALSGEDAASPCPRRTPGPLFVRSGPAARDSGQRCDCEIVGCFPLPHT